MSWKRGKQFRMYFLFLRTLAFCLLTLWPVNLLAADPIVCPTSISRAEFSTYEGRGWKIIDLEKRATEQSQQLPLAEFVVSEGGIQNLYPSYDVTSQEEQPSWAYYKLAGRSGRWAVCIYGQYDRSIGALPVHMSRSLEGLDFCVATISHKGGGQIAATCD